MRLYDLERIIRWFILECRDINLKFIILAVVKVDIFGGSFIIIKAL